MVAPAGAPGYHDGGMRGRLTSGGVHCTTVAGRVNGGEK